MDILQSLLESREAEPKSPAAPAPGIPGEGLLSRWIPAEDLTKPRKSKTYHPVILKLELLSQGLKISPPANAQIGKTLKSDHAVGAVGKHALDIILDPGKVYVGVPVGEAVSEHLTDGTPFVLDVDDGKYFIGKKPAVLRDNGRWQCIDDGAKPERLMSVTIPPYPHYYDQHTSRGHSMRSIMPIAGDFGGATIFPHCHYFGRFVDDYRHTECRFCGIDENLESGRDIFPKKPDDFLETVAEARKYPYFRHGPVFAGGTSPPPDRGAKAHALKDAFPDNWLRLTIAPPEEERFIDMLFEAGADLVGFNYEIFDPLLFAKMCPGKVRDIEKGRLGHAHYDRMLTYMVQTFGKGHASANLIAGLEPAQSTVEGSNDLRLRSAEGNDPRRSETAVDPRDDLHLRQSEGDDRTVRRRHLLCGLQPDADQHQILRWPAANHAGDYRGRSALCRLAAGGFACGTARPAYIGVEILI